MPSCPRLREYLLAAPLACSVLWLAWGCSSNPPPEAPAPVPVADSSPAESAPAASAAADVPSETPAPVPAASAAPASDEDARRSPQAIAELIGVHRAKVRACYDQAREKDPSLQGTLTLFFTLDPKGKVRKAELNAERSSIKDAELVQCAVQVLSTIPFPRSSKGMDTSINYPFHFTPGGAARSK